MRSSASNKRQLLEELRQLALQRAEKDAVFFLSNLTETIDEQDPANPYKPFPDKTYIKAIIPLLYGEPITFMPKSRSVMASWTVAGAAVWLCMTRPATAVVIQSRDETRAEKLIEYARTLYTRSDPEWQRRHPLKKDLSAQLKTVIEFANDSWMKAIPGTVHAIRSEHPTVVIDDEAAFMDEFGEAFNVSQGAKPLHIWALSSAAKGPFFDVLETATPCDWGGFPDEDTPGSLSHFRGADVVRPCPGLTFGRTNNGWAVVHLHYSADPARDAAWVAREKKRYTNLADWDKEQEIDPYAKDGALVYPEFDPAIHVVPHDRIPKLLTRYMCIDPHPRTPHAFVWCGLDIFGDFWVYRELWPSKVYGQARTLTNTDEENRFTIRDYVETVVHLEGNEVKWHHAETPDEYGSEVYLPGGERIVQRFMDQAGKAFSTGGDAAFKTENYWERYNRYGLQTYGPKKAHEAGEDAIRDLLRLRQHDHYGVWPKLHISARCPELILNLRRHRYAEMRKFDPNRELPQKGVDGRCHVLDDLRYLATANLTYIPTQESPECPHR